MAVHGSARQCTAYRGAGQPCNTVCGVSDQPPIDPTRPVHVYVQVADHIAARIASGDLRPGARLPAERDLAAEVAELRAQVVLLIEWRERQARIDAIMSTAPPPRPKPARPRHLRAVGGTS